MRMHIRLMDLLKKMTLEEIEKHPSLRIREGFNNKIVEKIIENPNK